MTTRGKIILMGLVLAVLSYFVRLNAEVESANPAEPVSVQARVPSDMSPSYSGAMQHFFKKF